MKAISEIVNLLKDLEEIEKMRVLKYVLDRFGIKKINEKEPLEESIFSHSAAKPLSQPRIDTLITDIRTLKDQKNPKTAIQMVALVAYYLQEIAPIVERKEMIDADDVIRYFKQAGYKLPAGKNGSFDTLNNAKNAGYLEGGTTRGTFKLNPVGYNLIAYGLPENTFTKEKKKSIKKKKKGVVSKKK